MTRDYALAPQHRSTEIEAHRADCPYVRILASEGVPVMTLLDCERPLPDDIPKHHCLDDEPL